MPSAIAHTAPALALIPAFARLGTPKRLWVLGVLGAAAPDLDVAAFSVGIPYEHLLGHRGLSHSIPFAAAAAALVSWIAFGRTQASLSWRRAWLYLFLVTASHGVLDTFTDGGLGVALLSPFDQTRYFAPFRPIQVSPLSIGRFLSERGVTILANELVWVWFPCAVLAVALRASRGLPSDSIRVGPTDPRSRAMSAPHVPTQLPDWIRDHVRRYRESNGADGHMWDSSVAGGSGLVPTLLLTTTGRKSKKRQVLPLIYGKTPDGYAIVASKGGAPAHPAWYLNLSADPDVEVQVGPAKFKATARTSSGAERAALWKQMAEIYPPYNDYQRRTQREIPVVVLEPLIS